MATFYKDSRLQRGSPSDHPKKAAPFTFCSTFRTYEQRRKTMNRKVRQFTSRFQYSLAASALVSAGPLLAQAQDSHSHMMMGQRQSKMALDQTGGGGALLKIVRDSTER